MEIYPPLMQEMRLSLQMILSLSKPKITLILQLQPITPFLVKLQANLRSGILGRRLTVPKKFCPIVINLISNIQPTKLLKILTTKKTISLLDHEVRWRSR